MTVRRTSVIRQGVFTELSSDTRLLVSSEGNLRVESVVTVDPDGTSLESVGGSDSVGDVSREDGGGESVPAKRKSERYYRSGEKRGTYMVSLAWARMSSWSLNLETTTTGPKTSSLTIFISGLTSVKIVGSMK